MLVVLVNESEGKAWKRTRRVLAKYLPQIGSRVWAGHISEEGLKDLHQEIRKVVSKSGSVACHRMLTRNRMELQWIAGQKAPYDELGRYAFRTVQASKEFTSPTQGAYGLLLCHVRTLAALLHDIGKATLGFQGKIRGIYCYEQYRHDLVGFLMLQTCFAKDGKPEDKAFLAKLEESSELWADANRLFELPKDTDTPNLKASELKQWLEHAPIFTLVSWLVLTHHRLPDGLTDIEVQNTGQGKEPNRGTHVNSIENTYNSKEVARKEQSQQAAGFSPWQDSGWRARCASVAKKITALLSQYPDLTEDLKLYAGDWILANVHYNRPLLIAADHLASIQCNNSGKACDKSAKVQTNELPIITSYANTTLDNKHWGDTVPQHLRRVADVTRKLTTLIANSQHFRTTILPSESLAINAINPDSDFYWQQKLAEIAEKNREHHPVFAAILAETGSGKTLAGVRLLNAISPKDEQGRPQLRYTLALGLRALTLQSGEALRDQAKIKPEDFVTLVGGLVLDFSEQTDTNNDVEKQQTASENAINHDEEGYAKGGFDDETENGDNMGWLDCLEAHMNGDSMPKRDRKAMYTIAKDWLGTRGLKLLDTPVVACTVDHLVPATHATSGGDARMALRIFTADLVLDEIDNYSAQDLITLGKLCFMVGLSGRHVVLMSATMSPFVVQGLFEAWWRGLSIKAKMDAPSFSKETPHKHPARQLFASNQRGSEVVCHDIVVHPSVEHCQQQYYGEYVHEVCEKIRNSQNIRRNLDILQLTPIAEAANKSAHLKNRIYPEILEGCYQLHQKNAQPVQDIQLSIGFIRFNTAKQAWLFSQWLLCRDSSHDKFEYRVVCYHAKHPRLVLGLMDEKLNKLNNRKKDSDWQQLEELKTAIEATMTAGKKQLMILIVTTTLQETGRDHDYDWAVLEPRSVRGEIQASGRVRRHRTEAWDKTNVLIMSQPMRAFDAGYDAEQYHNFEMPENFLLWGMPGIETRDIPICLPAEEYLQDYLNELNIHYQQGESKRVDLAKNALPINHWQTQGFDATLCLLTPENTAYDSNPIGTMEHLNNYARLNHPYDHDADANKQSLTAYLASTVINPALALTKKQVTLNRWRESLNKTIIVYCCSSDELNDLFTSFYQRDMDNNLSEFRNNEITIDEMLKEKVFFANLEDDVYEHFKAKPDYTPKDALFCELNYYNKQNQLNLIAFKYHWALGYCPK